jgi:hypothetical protein
VAVEYRTNGIRDGIVHVIAIHQDGEEAGDRALFASASAFEELGKQRKNRGRVTAGGGRFADRETDLPLSGGKPRH